MIKIDFEKTSIDGQLTYRDALYLEDDNAFTETEIEDMKQARFDKWYSLVTAVSDTTTDMSVMNG